MYFVDADSLRRALISDEVDQTDIAIYAFLSLGWSLPLFYWIRIPPDEPAVEIFLGYASVLADLAVSALGVRACFYENGGATGRDFASRFVALAWVLTFRIWLALLPTIVVLSYAGAILLTSVPSSVAEYFIYLVGPLFSAFYFWRLREHFRLLAGHAV